MLDAVVLPVQLEVKDTMDLKVVKENLVHLDQDLKDIQEIREVQDFQDLQVVRDHQETMDCSVPQESVAPVAL